MRPFTLALVLIGCGGWMAWPAPSPAVEGASLAGLLLLIGAVGLVLARRRGRSRSCAPAQG